MLTHTDVAIVGAGPYGLSVGAHLAARGMRFRIFGRAMRSWRSNMPRGMYLKSRGFASNLSDPAGEHTLEHFCKSIGSPYSAYSEPPISRELFARYGEWFQRSLVPDLDSRQVMSCEADSDGFRIRIEGGETIAAKSVVVSSGYMDSAHIPEQLAGLPSELVTHSSRHSSFEHFRNKDVAVIGAGQSALESAALLREAGARPSLVARCRDIAWGAPTATTGRVANPSSRSPGARFDHTRRSLAPPHTASAASTRRSSRSPRGSCASWATPESWSLSSASTNATDGTSSSTSTPAWARSFSSFETTAGLMS
jgi:cation diffusion facilitator CzcD-associated flavoprotein CzcO